MTQRNFVLFPSSVCVFCQHQRKLSHADEGEKSLKFSNIRKEKISSKNLFIQQKCSGNTTKQCARQTFPSLKHFLLLFYSFFMPFTLCGGVENSLQSPELRQGSRARLSFLRSLAEATTHPNTTHTLDESANKSTSINHTDDFSSVTLRC